MPYEGYDKNGNYVGIAANYLSFIEKKTGLKFERVPAKTWQDTIKKLESGEVDMITNYVNDGRELKDSAMTAPFFKSRVVVVRAEDESGYLVDLSELKGKKIGVVKDYTFIDKIVSANKQLNFVYFGDINEQFEALSMGKIDAAVSSIAIASYQIAVNGYSHLHIVGGMDSYMELGFEISGAKPELVDIINKTVLSMTPEEHEQMSRGWVKVDIHNKPVNYTLIIALLLIGTALPAMFWYWNRQLKREVQKKTYELTRVLGFFDEYVISSQTDLKGNITYASTAFCRVSGSTKEQLLGKNHRISKHPDNDPKVYEQMWATITKNEI